MVETKKAHIARKFALPATFYSITWLAKLRPQLSKQCIHVESDLDVHFTPATAAE